MNTAPVSFAWIDGPLAAAAIIAVTEAGRAQERAGARPTMRAISERVARKHGLSLADLRGPRRLGPVSLARHEAMWACHQTGLFTNTRIARFFKRTDHTTVIHARKAHERRMARGLA